MLSNIKNKNVYRKMVTYSQGQGFCRLKSKMAHLHNL